MSINQNNIEKSKPENQAGSPAPTSLEQRVLILQTAISTIADFVYVFDREGRFAFVNEPLLNLWGLKLDEAVGKNFFDLQYPAALAEKLQRQIEQVFVTKQALADETPYTSPTGVAGYYEYIFTPVLDAQGNVGMVSGCTRDVSSHKNIARELVDTKRRVESALIAGEVGTYEWDIIADRVYGDSNFKSLFQVSVDETGGAPLAAFIAVVHPEDREATVARIEHSVKTGKPCEAEYRLMNKNGVRWISARGRVEPDPSGKPVRFHGVILDITSRKQAEDERFAISNEIQRLSYIYETILSTTNDFAYIFDSKGRFIYANRRLLAVWAKSLDQIVGKDLYELGYPTWHADMHMREIAQIIETRQSIQGEVPFTGASGISGIYDYIFTPVLDAKGGVEIIVGTTRDVTKRKQSEEELRAAQSELWKRTQELEIKISERTASLVETVGELESFSYSIVHDMRAPLRSMQGYASILVREYMNRLEPEALGYLQRISSSAQRMDRLIQDVLSFSRVARADLKLEPVNTDALLRDILETYPDLRAHQEHIHILGRLPVVMGNEAALTQCFSNLIGNALKFVAPGQTPLVNISAAEDGPTVRISFQDNGIGVPDALHQRIFELFQRGTQSHEGTGIGLPIVKKSVERMGGQVGMTSKPGQGSTFWLDLNLIPGDQTFSQPA